MVAAPAAALTGRSQRSHGGVLPCTATFVSAACRSRLGRIRASRMTAVEWEEHMDPDVTGDVDRADQSRVSSTGSALSQRDRAMLAFERAWWRRGGVKEEAIREEFGISTARYYQLLGALIDSQAALLEDPMLVKRLQRLRDARTVRRAELLRAHPTV